MPKDKKPEVESAIEEAKKVLAKPDADESELTSAKEKISSILQSFAQEMYSQAGANPEAAANTENSSSKSKSDKAKQAETVDADFEVVDEEDKK